MFDDPAAFAGFAVHGADRLVHFGGKAGIGLDPGADLAHRPGRALDRGGALLGAVRQVVGSGADFAGVGVDVMGRFEHRADRLAQRGGGTVEIQPQLVVIGWQRVVEHEGQVLVRQMPQALPHRADNALERSLRFAHGPRILAEYRHRLGHASDAVAVLGIVDRAVDVAAGQCFHPHDGVDVGRADQTAEQRNDEQRRQDDCTADRDRPDAAGKHHRHDRCRQSKRGQTAMDGEHDPEFGADR